MPERNTQKYGRIRVSEERRELLQGKCLTPNQERERRVMYPQIKQDHNEKKN